MNWLMKWLTVPKSDGDTKQVQAVQLWEVRWTSRYDKWVTDTRPEVEAFTTAEEAEKFAASLRMAFRLVRHTSETEVIVLRAS